MLKRFYLLVLCCTVILLFKQCTPNKNTDIEKEINSNISDKIFKDSLEINKVRVIFYNVPSPVEMSNIIKQSGVDFNPDFLNSPKNAEHYISSSKLALNLGVYGADLSFVRMLDQVQESFTYLSIIRKFSEKLEIPNDKGSLTVSRFENNLDNRDSLITLVAETYASADVYLKENKRESTAALIILGGWIEAMNIAMNILDKENPNKIIITRIAEQKFSLDNLIELMNINKTDETIAAFIPKLQALKTSYSKIIFKPQETTVVTDNNSKETSISSKDSIQITIADIAEINSIISKIKEDIVK